MFISVQFISVQGNTVSIKFSARLHLWTYNL